MKISEVMAGWRYSVRISSREAAAHIGVDHSALFRLEKGKPISEANLAAVIRWLLSS